MSGNWKGFLWYCQRKDIFEVGPVSMPQRLTSYPIPIAFAFPAQDLNLTNSTVKIVKGNGKDARPTVH